MGRDSVVAIAIATDWAVRWSNPGVGVEIFCTCSYQRGGKPILLFNGYRDFPEVKAAGAWPYSNFYLAPRLKK
jgi:hypothetical protein